ncbi:DUF2520 domain-containing protein [Gramella sp. BOM4]|nr:DUF2520 domain-containing protein [Christiangramia bathymodioli]
MINVVIIGAGNVAAHLYRSISAAEDLQVSQVYNRTAENLGFVRDFKKRCTDINELEKAELFLIAVKDEAIEEIADVLPDSGGVVAHTSGSQSLKTLSKFQNFGVFYPLQTFSKNKEVNFREVPVCLEASSDENLEFLKEVAGKVSDKIFEVNSEQRKALHLSAVFVNNFSNHLYALAAEYCKENGLPFKILQPLIKETAAKIETLPPYSAQTGPALRNDQKTIAEHLKMLNKDQKNIYSILTQSIQKLHGKEL